MMLGFLMVALAMAAAHTDARPPALTRSACGLLTRADLAAVQGEAYAETKLTSRGTTSQCFYQLPTFVKSVSLDLTRSGGRELWRERFVEREEGEGGEHEEAKRPPKRVRGVGDGAFWVGGPVAGSLYVRKGDAILRVSAGGPGTEGEKIERSKKLAKRALRRM